jgi:hypothetical protein
VFLSNINYIIKDISYFNLYKVKYIIINKELIFNLDLLILKSKKDIVYKRVKVFKLNYI